MCSWPASPWAPVRSLVPGAPQPPLRLEGLRAIVRSWRSLGLRARALEHPAAVFFVAEFIATVSMTSADLTDGFKNIISKIR